jgi:hypothetical protein
MINKGPSVHGNPRVGAKLNWQVAFAMLTKKRKLFVTKAGRAGWRAKREAFTEFNIGTVKVGRGEKQVTTDKTMITVIVRHIFKLNVTPISSSRTQNVITEAMKNSSLPVLTPCPTMDASIKGKGKIDNAKGGKRSRNGEVARRIWMVKVNIQIPKEQQGMRKALSSRVYIRKRSAIGFGRWDVTTN